MIPLFKRVNIKAHIQMKPFIVISVPSVSPDMIESRSEALDCRLDIKLPLLEELKRLDTLPKCIIEEITCQSSHKLQGKEEI
jgi:hypothetical protein